jgi:membrane protease YdiL (CAAX protease family)
VNDTPSVLPLPARPPADDVTPRPLARWAAGLQAAIVCGIPTQLAVTAVLSLVLHMPMYEGGQMSFDFFVALSLVDTGVIVLLVHTFLRMSGEQPADVLVGPRAVRGEALRGLALVPVVFLVVTAIVLGIRAIAPSMHTVETNPFETFLHSPAQTAVFTVVVVLAGGVREELQRAFIVHRFAQRLGGAHVGLAVFSVLFGTLHLEQGADVAVAIGLLGLLWGILYVRRGSAILPMVNHGAFNAVQVLQSVVAKLLGA